MDTNTLHVVETSCRFTRTNTTIFRQKSRIGNYLWQVEGDEMLMAGHNSKEVDLQPPKGCLLVCFSFAMNSEKREHFIIFHDFISKDEQMSILDWVTQQKYNKV